MCAKGFAVSPSLAHVICCSQQCSRIRLKGVPRNYTPESYARITGRPKTSLDVTRGCPTCSTEFTVPEWDPKIYCSRECYVTSRCGRGSGPSVVKICEACQEAFRVAPSRGHAACCSKSCMGERQRRAAASRVRVMTDGEGNVVCGTV